jgi:allantoicase
VSTRDESAATFTGLVDLAAESFGGRALGASDEFFASRENLLKPGRGVFIEGKFTERGKWMDGWESRRKRAAGHDSCVIELGARGQLLGFDIDTHHFVGNHPPFASVDGLYAAPGTSYEALLRLPWGELLPQSRLLPDAQNLFVARPDGPISHVRLNIYPDGGVARFRVFGRVQPEFGKPELDAESAPRVAAGWVDLAALKNGARALACSDAFFGPMNNLLSPGRAENMGGGWETRRKRQPGHDFILIELAARGQVQLVEVDTNHFRGNYPDRCSLDVLDADALYPGVPGAGAPPRTARTTDLLASTAWQPLLPERKLGAHARHFFGELGSVPAATHARLNIFPDGGVSRLRLWGTRDV